MKHFARNFQKSQLKSQKSSSKVKKLKKKAEKGQISIFSEVDKLYREMRKKNYF